MITGALCERMLASASGSAVVQKAHSAETPADDPMGPAAAGAMVDLMLAVDGVIAPSRRVVRLARIAES